MAQTYQMKHNPQGTIYSLLTVESDGQMTMTFHGTDREICHDVTENEDGWLCYPGGMFPGLESGKWQLMDDGRCMMEDGRGKMDDGRCKMEDVVETADCADSTDNEPEVIVETADSTDNEPEVIVETADCTDNEPEVIVETTNYTNYTADEPLTMNRETITNNHEPLTINHDCRPRRQRKPRKPRVERQPSAISHQTSDIDHQPSALSHQPSSTLKAVGMVAAATVALFVIYETGLLIPLGLIGLATGGILK